MGEATGPDEPVGGDRADLPKRPAGWGDLSWQPQPAVRWFSPAVVADSGVRVALATVLGAYLDKRELQAAIATKPVDLSGRDELWIDYVADTGDGFPATYSVAWTIARRQLDLPGLQRPLRRGDLLVLGGDQVYPTPSPRSYEQRFLGPFTAALPWAQPESRVLALPGNHDWYDGLTSFMRVFCQQKALGGRRMAQTRSYFAAQLPHRWWLWGVDSQISSYIDEPQLRFFESLDLREGDRIILCVAEPTWVDAPHDPHAYRNVAHLERKFVRPKGACIHLTLAGGLHHYARYVGEDGSQKVTSGGGGAFTYPTHFLPDALSLRCDPERPEEAVRHHLAKRHPGPVWSRLQAFAAIGLAMWNPTFLALPALVDTLLLVGVIRRQRASATPWHYWDVVGNLFAGPATLSVILLLTLTLVAFADPPKVLRRPIPRAAIQTAMGVTHAFAQVLAAAGAAWVASRLTDQVAGVGGTLLAVVLAVGLAAAASAIILGGYLGIATGVPPKRWIAHSNETFAAQRRTDAKQFVRLHLDRDGVLRLYAVGLRSVCRRWAFDPDAAEPDDPWLIPQQDLDIRLVDGPVTIGRRASEG